MEFKQSRASWISFFSYFEKYISLSYAHKCSEPKQISLKIDRCFYRHCRRRCCCCRHHGVAFIHFSPICNTIQSFDPYLVSYWKREFLNLFAKLYFIYIQMAIDFEWINQNLQIFSFGRKIDSPMLWFGWNEKEKEKERWGVDSSNKEDMLIPCTIYGER